MSPFVKFASNNFAARQRLGAPPADQNGEPPHEEILPDLQHLPTAVCPVHHLVTDHTVFD